MKNRSHLEYGADEPLGGYLPLAMPLLQSSSCFPRFFVKVLPSADGGWQFPFFNALFVSVSFLLSFAGGNAEWGMLLEGTLRGVVCFVLQPPFSVCVAGEFVY